jgi:hypothetical protein
MVGDGDGTSFGQHGSLRRRELDVVGLDES